MRPITIATMIVLVASAAAPAQGPALRGTGKRVDERFSRESDNQTRVSRELTQLVTELEELVNDAESNQVYSQADGAALDSMKKALRGTNQDRVVVAAAELRQAIAAVAGRETHVREAGRQVQTAQEELTNLLRQANALMLEDTIGQEIQDILRDQQELSQQTAEAARAQLQEQAPLTDPAELAQEQQQLARRVKKLQESMQQAMQEELSEEAAEKLQKAQQVAEKRGLDELEQKALEELESGELAGAFEQQMAAMEALGEMAELLSDAQRPSDEALAALEKMLAQQQELREKTAGLTPEQFLEQAAKLQLEQLNLAKELPANSTAAEPMAAAAQQLEKMDQAEAVAAQMKAEAALGAAMEKAMGPGPGVPGAKGQSGTDDKGDGDSDNDKEGRGNEGKGKKGKGKKPGPPKGETPPNEDGPPSEDGEPMENASVQPMQAKNKPSRTPNNPRAGERLFEKTDVEGQLPTSSASTWTSLSTRERDALGENFARELPREFRDMLKVYYEELSK
jgi:hypothetical protein